MRWVLLDETNGAPCQNGETLTPEKLAVIAEGLTIQLDRDYAPECGAPGGGFSVRAGAGPADIQVGECVFAFVAAMPEAGLVAYHDKDGNGVPYAIEDITKCSSLMGQGGSASSAASHELLEAARDPGCNRLLDDGKGGLHADEACDAIEANTYPITTRSGEVVYVSDFLLDSWRTVGGQAPYTYSAKAGLPAVSQPSGPMQTAPADGSNYQIIGSWSAASEGSVFGFQVAGKPARPHRVGHPSTRGYKRAIAAFAARVEG